MDDKTLNETREIDSQWWEQYFSERDLQLIKNCQTYRRNGPAGLPGHNLMIIIDKLVELIGNTKP